MDIDAATIRWGNQSSGITIKYDKERQEIVIDRGDAGFNFNNLNNNEIRAPYILPQDKKVELEMWVDKSSVEIFVNDGERVLTFLVFPHTAFGDIAISANKQANFVESFEILPIELGESGIN